jgi:hypothetical protein
MSSPRRISLGSLEQYVLGSPRSCSSSLWWPRCACTPREPDQQRNSHCGDEAAHGHDDYRRSEHGTPGARTPQPREQDDAARVVAPQAFLEATKGVPAAPSGYIKECSCLPPLLTSQVLLRGNWRQSLHAQLPHVREVHWGTSGLLGLHWFKKAATLQTTRRVIR